MKKICLNCTHSKWVVEDLEAIRSTEKAKLVCASPYGIAQWLWPRIRPENYPIKEDNDTCCGFNPSKQREEDIKNGC